MIISRFLEPVCLCPKKIPMKQPPLHQCYSIFLRSFFLSIVFMMFLGHLYYQCYSGCFPVIFTFDRTIKACTGTWLIVEIPFLQTYFTLFQKQFLLKVTSKSNLWGSYYNPNLILTSPHHTSPNFTSPHITSPHLTSPHLTSPHLTSPHLT